MRFLDKDLDERIGIGIYKLEPLIDFHYRGKTRLNLGTNWTTNKDTGDETTMRGSICTYDNKGNVTSKMPQ